MKHNLNQNRYGRVDYNIRDSADSKCTLCFTPYSYYICRADYSVNNRSDICTYKILYIWRYDCIRRLKGKVLLVAAAVQYLIVSLSAEPQLYSGRSAAKRVSQNRSQGSKAAMRRGVEAFEAADLNNKSMFMILSKVQYGVVEKTKLNCISLYKVQVYVHTVLRMLSPTRFGTACCGATRYDTVYDTT